MTDLSNLLDQLKAWRETELAAKQDVEDAECHVIAADLKAEKAKGRLLHVVAKVESLHREVRKAIDEQTAPPITMFMSEGED